VTRKACARRRSQGGCGDALTGLRAVLLLLVRLVAVRREGHEPAAPVLVVRVAVHQHAMTCMRERERERERDTQRERINRISRTCLSLLPSGACMYVYDLFSRPS